MSEGGMSWANAYVGLPYRPRGSAEVGHDCWSLVGLVYARELGIALPPYVGEACEAELAEIHAAVAGATASPLWRPVAEAEARAFDVATFRRGALVAHVGLVLRPGLMLHLAAGDCAKVEAFDRGPWATRWHGIWRHVSRVEGVPAEGSS